MTNPPTTRVIFHDITHLHAASSYAADAPTVLQIETSFGNAEIVLYLDNQSLADTLTMAINTAMEAHLRSTPPAAETAAYAALHRAYNGGGQ
jgi:hypothetical protein